MIPLRDSVPTSKRPLITYGLILINVFVFLLEFTSPNITNFIDRYALIASRISLIRPLTLFSFLTYQFLHAGLAHLLSNMWFLKIFGDNIEEVLGHFKFLLFYLISGVVAAISQYLLIINSSIPMLGASGAVAGVLGAYLVFFPHHRIETLIPVWGFWRIVNLPASFMLLYWFIIQLFAGAGSLIASPALVGGVAFFAHVGGFAGGWLMAKIAKR